jgi:hypothetical protein
VSEQAHIKGNPLGFGLGIAIADINQDGWPDIYVSNDYIEQDYSISIKRMELFQINWRLRLGI